MLVTSERASHAEFQGTKSALAKAHNLTQVVIGLHSLDQSGRDRSLEPGPDRRDGHRAVAAARPNNARWALHCTPDQ